MKCLTYKMYNEGSQNIVIQLGKIGKIVYR